MMPGDAEDVFVSIHPAPVSRQAAGLHDASLGHRQHDQQAEGHADCAHPGEKHDERLLIEPPAQVQSDRRGADQTDGTPDGDLRIFRPGRGDDGETDQQSQRPDLAQDHGDGKSVPAEEQRDDEIRQPVDDLIARIAFSQGLPGLDRGRTRREEGQLGGKAHADEHQQRVFESPDRADG